ncbi:MAG: TonB-dependent receptor [Candidatus Latescibacterota bacterium]
MHPCRPAVLLCALLLAGPSRAADLDIAILDARTGQPLAGAYVTLDRGGRPVAADQAGRVRLQADPGPHQVHASHVGYVPRTARVALDSAGTSLRLALQPHPVEVPGVATTASRAAEEAGHASLSSHQVRHYPAAAPDPVHLTRVIPGVMASSDLSNRYSVQGGSYAANLIYLNGVGVELPLQVRHGLAGSVSPVNPLLTEEVEFRGGTFPARYGDRLSSVLDVRYRLPTEGRGAAVVLSSQQQNVALSARAPGGVRLTTGLRRVDLTSLTRHLQTSGDYRPRFHDGQLLAEWQPRAGGRLTLTGVALDSRFDLAPARRVLRYNCARTAAPGGSPCDQFTADGRGHEAYGFSTSLLGLRWRREGPGRAVEVRSSLFAQQETEDTDLSFDTTWESRQGGRVQPLRVVEVHQSRLSLWRWEGALEVGRGPYEWGAGAQWARLHGHARDLEETTDSAVSGDRTEAPLAQVRHAAADLHAHAQRTWKPGPTRVALGARLVRFGSTGEALVLPRLSATWDLRPRWSLLLAAGRHAQPPLYREFLATGGHRSEKALHLSAGVSCLATPSLRIRMEAYRRWLTDLLPYELDDLRLVYAGGRARGRTQGLAVHLRGQWNRLTGTASYGYLRAREDLEGDGRGYIPGPMDQRHTASLYVEDRMALRPGLPLPLLDSLYHLRVLYGSGLPYTPRVAAAPGAVPAQTNALRHARREDTYLRFDMGMTQTMDVGGRRVSLREEVANVFNEFNVVGHTYLPLPSGSPVELVRGQGRRTYNLVLSTSSERAR